MCAGSICIIKRSLAGARLYIITDQIHFVNIQSLRQDIVTYLALLLRLAIDSQKVRNGAKFSDTPQKKKKGVA